MPDPETPYQKAQKMSPEVQKKIKSFLTFVKIHYTGAEERRKEIKAINQARWIIKFRKGVSDSLKAKCLPANQKLLDALKTAQKTCETAIKKVDEFNKASKVMNTIKITPSSTKKEREARDKVLNQAMASILYVLNWSTTEDTLRDNITLANNKEIEALTLLNDYLRDKETMKEMGKEDYQKFKKQYETLAKKL